jgi:hypothetical protein
MRFRKAVTPAGREGDVIDGLRLASTGEEVVAIDGVLVVPPTPSRAQACVRIDRRMKELIASGEASSMRQAFHYALRDLPDAARSEPMGKIARCRLA